LDGAGHGQGWRSFKLSNDKAFAEKLHDVVGGKSFLPKTQKTPPEGHIMAYKKK
jgi:hypothetical protein